MLDNFLIDHMPIREESLRTFGPDRSPGFNPARLNESATFSTALAS
jgi:hypothetical protein